MKKVFLLLALLTLGACENHGWVNVNGPPARLSGYPNHNGYLAQYGTIGGNQEQHFQAGLGWFVRVKETTVERYRSATGQLCESETVVEVFTNGRAEWDQKRTRPTQCTHPGGVLFRR